jgi:hypothetical protein
LRGGEREAVVVPSSSSPVPPDAAIAHDVDASQRPIEVDEREPEPLTEEQREPVRTANAAESTIPFGTLVVSVADHSVLGPLRWYRARVASETRFADESGDGSGRDLELRLTPGNYSIVIFSPGYETTELPPVTVPRGETVRLPHVELRPGSGRIQGSVIGDLSPDRKFTVELLGEGRHPCAHCRDVDAPPRLAEARSRPDWAWEHIDPCPTCGFERTSGRISVGSSDRFAFQNLASGCYAVRLSEGTQTIGDAQRIVLDVGEVRSIVFDVSQTRAVMVEMTDADGSSLSDEWARRLAESKTDEEVVSPVSYVEPSAVRFVFLENQRDIAQATFEPPAPRQGRSIRPAAFGGRRLGQSSKSPRSPVIHDRERTAKDALHPACGDPHFAASEVRCAIDASGVLKLEPIPSSPLDLRVSMGHASASVAIPASRGSVKVSVRLGAAK